MWKIGKQPTDFKAFFPENVRKIDLSGGIFARNVFKIDRFGGSFLP